MAASTKVRVSASPAQVRAWAETEGLIPKGQRGRLGEKVIEKYNATHGLKHTEKAYVPTVRHTAKPAKGRKVTRTVNVALVRKAAADAGVFTGKRGTLPTSVLDAYVLGQIG